MIPVWQRAGRKPPAAASGYALDSYTANLWGCWAPYRLLTSWTGAYIRVRRSSDNAEADCSSDAAIASHCGASNGFVVKLYDQSGNGRTDFAQSTNANQPQIYDGSAIIRTINSNPAMYASGGAVRIDGPVMSGSGLTTVEVFCAARNDADPPATQANAGPCFSSHLSTGGADSHTPWTDGVCYVRFFSNTRQSGNPTTSLSSSWCYNGVSTSMSQSFFVNSETVITASNVFDLSSSAVVMCGTRDGGTDYGFNGAVGALAIYSASKSSDRAAIRAALAGV